MSGWNPQANDVFLKALELQAPEQRRKLLDETCGENVELRAQVESLLAASERAGSFLQSPPAGLGEAVTADTERPALEGAGTIIGRYKLLQQIGEGGMGVVFMAEQTHPVKRIVALKIIKPGMDSRLVIARFEAERQALALMEHPNIAKVLDAGTTDSGRPYFVMELVKGIPITKYCDEHHLTPRQRLELFVPVCHAVQHAHQKGIIHRDLKPSNILIAQYDSKPVPKVIDFGVAKAAGSKLTERTMFTGFGSIIGTLEYMSPEQAELNQLDVDTRSDIYSLGVLLYELLTGTTPLEHKRLKEGAFHELLRIIREEEPPKPSTRLSTSEQMPSIAANRGLEPAKLSGAVRGELDWIVMKALEKDRNRRYETANSLAMDVQRHLNDEAVQACPPSARYRFGKFARRNKVVITTTALVCAALVLGTIISVGQAIRASRARIEAVHQAGIASKEATRADSEAANARSEADNLAAVNQFLNDMLGAADPTGTPGPDRGKNITVAQVLDEAVRKLEAGSLKDKPRIEAVLRTTIGRTYVHLGRVESARAQLEIALNLNRKIYGLESRIVAKSLDDLSGPVFILGNVAQAETLLRQAVAMQKRFSPSYHNSRTLLDLAGVLQHQGKLQEAEALCRDAIALRLQAPPEFIARARPYGALASVLQAQGKFSEAEALYRQVLAMDRGVNDIYRVAGDLTSLAELLAEQAKWPEVEALYREGLEIRRGIWGDEEGEVGWTRRRFAELLQVQGKIAEAEALHREAVRLLPNSASAHLGLGQFLIGQGKGPEAAAEFEEAMRLRPNSVPTLNGIAWLLATDPQAQHRDSVRAVQLAERAVKLAPQSGSIWNTLGVARYRNSQWQDAIAALQKSIELGGGAGAYDMFFLAMAHWQLGEREQARKWYDRAVAWMDKNQPKDAELRQFHTEAATLLGLPVPATQATTHPSTAATSPSH